MVNKYGMDSKRLVKKFFLLQPPWGRYFQSYFELGTKKSARRLPSVWTIKKILLRYPDTEWELIAQDPILWQRMEQQIMQQILQSNASENPTAAKDF